MGTIDVDQLLAEISADTPSGENLEYDAAYGELERVAQGRPEQQIGDQKKEAQPPDWRDVGRRCLDLLSRSKDLRIAQHLVRAQLHSDGLVGFADGLAYMRGLIERYWQSVHPELDPDDDNDPTMRVNAINALTDPATVLNVVRTIPLTNSRGLGRFSYREIQIARGEQPPAGNGQEAPPDMAAIDGAFADSDPEELQALAGAARAALEHVQAIDALVTEQVGVAQAPSLDKLSELLTGIDRVLAERTGGSEASAAPAPDRTAAPAAGEPSPAGQPTGVPSPAVGGPGEINRPEDVIAALDRICAYYQRHEPSSPVPLLLQRAKRLVSKNFMEIMQDLAPDGVNQVEKISGNDSEKSKS